MKPIALITGASSGIGEATALLLAQNNLDIIITGRRLSNLKQLKEKITAETNADVIILNYDIRSFSENKKAIESLPGPWRKIDVLINNAGLAAGFSTFQEGSIEDWERMIDTNLKGLLYISRLIIPGMIERGKGHIVNISSIAGIETYPMGNVYCASKHAVQSLTKGMRIDLVKHGIRVSSICPGAVDTEFSTVRFNGDTNRAKQVYSGFTPLYAQDVADTILFIITRLKHVNIDDILIMPTDQAYSRDFNRKEVV